MTRSRITRIAFFSGATVQVAVVLFSILSAEVSLRPSPDIVRDSPGLLLPTESGLLIAGVGLLIRGWRELSPRRSAVVAWVTLAVLLFISLRLEMRGGGRFETVVLLSVFVTLWLAEIMLWSRRMSEVA